MSFCDDYTLLDDELNVYRSINYKNVMQMFTNMKTGVIFLGGAWCKNCQAVIHIVNAVAKKNKIRTIHHFDPIITNVFKEEVDWRDCGDLETKMDYYAFIEKIGYKSDTLVQDTLIPRINVPAIIGIKNGDCVGIIDDEYIYDEAGLHFEDEFDDKTVEFEEKLDQLFKRVKAKEKNEQNMPLDI